MTKSSEGILLYRATTDGFTAQAFHSKCDGKGNAITIIKNNLNHMFGGYSSSAWNSSKSYINDPNAFLFSLRRAGVSTINSLLNKHNMRQKKRQSILIIV